MKYQYRKCLYQLNVSHGDLEQGLEEALCALWTLRSLQYQLLQSAYTQEGTLLEWRTMSITHTFISTYSITFTCKIMVNTSILHNSIHVQVHNRVAGTSAKLNNSAYAQVP